MPLPPDAFPFPPYEKIAESLAAWLGDDEAAYRAVSRSSWIVTEKIHGANCCLVTNGEAIRDAKRKAFLAEDEDFFGHRALLAELRPSILQLHAEALVGDTRIALVYMYGELFGGGYPHADVPAVPGVAPVQTGCWYTSGIELCVFDVGVLYDGAGERVYLARAEATRLCESAGLMFARPLSRGTYEDCLAFPLGFETTLPPLLGLPSLGATHKAERVVLKPTSRIVVPRRPGSIRPVIKRKIPEFSEDERFHGAEKWSPPRAPAAGVPALDMLKAEASALVNENRLAAAISKVGPVRADDAARLAEVCSLVREDLQDELRRRCGPALGALSGFEALQLSRFVEGEARALVELYLGAPSS
jgi:Rnl2 family RNA ligase